MRTSRSATAYTRPTKIGKIKLQSKAIGPFVGHVAPAPRLTTTDTVPHHLLDGLDQRKPPPATADEYVIDKLVGLRQTGASCSAKERWFDYGSKDDTWEPLEYLSRNLVVRFLRQKKKHVLLIPEFCPRGQKPRLTLNKSTLFV